jgi:hypothetical protein
LVACTSRDRVNKYLIKASDLVRFFSHPLIVDSIGSIGSSAYTAGGDAICSRVPFITVLVDGMCG